MLARCFAPAWLAGLLLLLAAVGCKCGEDEAGADGGGIERDYASTVPELPAASELEVARLVPPGPGLVLVAARPDAVLRWLRQRPWWQKLTATPFWADLSLSDPLHRLSTARHRLANLSPVELEQPELEPLLASPMALALQRTETGWGLLLVKRIDLRVQAIDRLAEAFNQARGGGLHTTEVHGLPVRSFAIGPQQAVHYALYSNLLLLSNEPALLERAVALAAGASEQTLLGSDANQPLFDTGDPGQLEIYCEPAALSPWLGHLLPLAALRLSWHLDDAPRAEVVGRLADPAADAAGPARDLRPLLPHESRLVLGHSRLRAAELAGALFAALGEQAAGLPDLESRLLDRLQGHFALAVTRFALPVPEAVLLLRLTEPAGVEPVLAELLGLSLGAHVEQQGELWVTSGGRLEPAFAVRGDWLVLGTSRAAAARVLDTAHGRAPALADRPGVAAVFDRAEPMFGLAFVDSGALAADVQTTAARLLDASERFDAQDLEDTLTPLFRALGEIGLLAGGLRQQEPPVAVRGRVVAL
jgi:hypothetical protein